MSFFKKLKDRMFRSSDKLGEGLDALIAAPDQTAAAPEKSGLLARLIPSAEAPRRVMRSRVMRSRHSSRRFSRPPCITRCPNWPEP